jgi:aminopeptidase N
MIRVKKIITGFFILLFYQQCSFIGIHTHVKNPKKPGTYPNQTRAQMLLAHQTSRRTCYDVNYYRLNLQLGFKKKFIRGEVLIRSVLLNREDTIQLDLYKNLQINSLRCNNHDVPYRRDEGAVFVKLPINIAARETFSIVVNYEGRVTEARRPPWNGGITWKKAGRGSVWAGVSCESEGAGIWWPNKDDLADEADSVDLLFTLPNKSKLSIVSNGVLKQTKTNPDNTKTLSWHVSYPINNYNLTFYLGDYQLITDTFVSPNNKTQIPLSYYVSPKHASIAKNHFQQVKQQLAFYERVFGDYPWPMDGYKLVESPFEGMEHQTAIAYGSKFKNSVFGLDYIILHETAHEWWGNSVTAADLSDVWLQEGFATYAEALYIEATQGQPAYLTYMYWQRLSIKNKRPIVRPRGIRYFSTQDEDVYNKGSWVLHSLRNTIKNDSVFFDILKTFRKENHLKQIYSENFIALVNRKTGKDYDWFFRQYLYRREAPILEYYWVGEYFYYKWKDTGVDFNKLPVELDFGSGRKTVYPDVFLQKLKVDDPTATGMYFPCDATYFGFVKNSHLVEE